MNLPSLATLFARSALAEIFDLGIAVARKLNVPVDTWQPGDPTRTQFRFLAEYLDAFEGTARNYVASSFLGLARALAEEDPAGYPWLVRLAYELYGYEADEATFAATKMTLTNAKGASYSEAELAAGLVTYQNLTTGATYTAVSGPVDADDNPAPLLPVSQAPGNVVYQYITADVAGSGSSAAGGEIALQTAIPGVTATNPAAAQGIDAESPASIEQGAREQLGPLSPNGPADAFNSVAKNKALTGAPGVTRARTYTDSTLGYATIYLAGPSGAVTPEEVTLVEAAIVRLATPGCVTPVVQSAINRVLNVTYEIWLYDNVGQTSAEVKATARAALLAFFLLRPIGGDVKESESTTGKVWLEGIKQAIKGAFGTSYLIDVRLTVPGADTPLTKAEVPVLGEPTAVVHFEPRAKA